MLSFISWSYTWTARYRTLSRRLCSLWHNHRFHVSLVWNRSGYGVSSSTDCSIQYGLENVVEVTFFIGVDEIVALSLSIKATNHKFLGIQSFVSKYTYWQWRICFLDLVFEFITRLFYKMIENYTKIRFDGEEKNENNVCCVDILSNARIKEEWMFKRKDVKRTAKFDSKKPAKNYLQKRTAILSIHHNHGYFMVQ